MSSPEVDWVLDQWTSVVTWAANNYTLSNGDPVQLERVDRDDSQLLEGGIRSRTGELQEAVYAGATLADVANSPIGTEFDFDREAVVGVRIEGLHHSEFGHVDPDGANGVPWSDLVAQLRDAILSERVRPGGEPSGVEYHHLTIANEAPQSSNWADYYRHDFDVVFQGYEELP